MDADEGEDVIASATLAGRLSKILRNRDFAVEVRDSAAHLAIRAAHVDVVMAARTLFPIT